ncbi:hypothetical protein BVG16_18055 [Paenibacillus selenitireducens]|uniref:Uncharacterized protein n=1 Tax=Paenibacillus selenitireducens TaxID=1324314 RepID=A0A1T2X8B7_9BACL|nr:hypothetical protein [Paenibacillus selenitireducens]OPA76121.1 hypothetical protein BVG16_18055 [Paenibacillus selenitireducens]
MFPWVYLFIVMLFISFYAVIAIGIILLIYKRSKEPERRSAQFLALVLLLALIVYLGNWISTGGGKMNTMILLMITILIMVCVRHLKTKRK